MDRRIILTIIAVLVCAVIYLALGEVIPKPAAGGIGVFVGLSLHAHLVGMRPRDGIRRYLIYLLFLLFVSLIVVGLGYILAT